MKRPGCFVKYSSATIPLVTVDTWNWNLTSFGSSSSNSTSKTRRSLDHRVLETFVVHALLQPGLLRHRANRVVLVGELLHLVHRRIARAIEARHHDLGQATVLRPVDRATAASRRASSVMSTCELMHLRPTSLETFLNSVAADLVQAAEPEVVLRVPRRAELDRLNPGVGQHLHRARKVLVDVLAVAETSDSRSASRTGWPSTRLRVTR